MDYGIKCEPKRLDAEDWHAAYGDLPRLAREVRAHGVTFIEFRWDEDTPEPLMLQAARQAADAGLWVSIHPYLWHLGPEAFREPTHAAGLRQVFDLAEAASAVSGRDVPLVFHPGHVNCDPHRVPYDEAVAHAHEFFAWAAEEVRVRRPHVRIQSETQLPFTPGEEPRHRLGDTWAECLSLIEGTPLGVCWDFGHTFWSASLGKHPAAPPPEFLRRVRHVHAHDVIERGGTLVDHQPLGTGLAPWRENCRRLASVGFSGGILFEVDIMPFGGYVGLTEMLRSVTSEINAIFTHTSAGGRYTQRGTRGSGWPQGSAGAAL
jgi:sugar phosphate isomerase/epimerase